MGDSNKGAFLTGFLFGGLAGAAAALLMTPQPGETTRLQIKDRGIELKTQFGDLTTGLQERGKVILEEKTTDPAIKLNFDNPKIKDEILVIFSVKLADDESVTSNEFGIKRLSDEETQEIGKTLNALKAEVGDDSPLDKLIYASFYEENDLLIDALTNYISAMEMSPEVEDFQTAYDQFIIRNGLGN